MLGLTMDFPLTLQAIFRHAERVFPQGANVTRRPDRSLHQYTVAEFAVRARRLARALEQLGIRPAIVLQRSRGTRSSIRKPTSAASCTP
jgi:fatty-acyl-CoA synthase